MRSYSLVVLTPTGPVYRAQVISLVAPAVGGKLGVLAGHMPLVTVLNQGTLLCREDSGVWVQFATGSGILEVRPGGVEVTVDWAQRVPLSVPPRY